MQTVSLKSFMNVADVQSNWHGEISSWREGGEALDHEMPLDAIGRIVALDFLIACQLKCSELPEGDGYIEVGCEEPKASQQVHHLSVFR